MAETAGRSREKRSAPVLAGEGKKRGHDARLSGAESGTADALGIGVDETAALVFAAAAALTGIVSADGRHGRK
jgi:hypothetical protein